MDGSVEELNADKADAQSTIRISRATPWPTHLETAGESMARTLTAAEKMEKARKMIQQVRDLPVPEPAGRSDFSYIAQVKALILDAKDLIKFIPRTVTATDEIKKEVQQIVQEADETQKDLLEWKLSS
jgi:uncharacterized coiled-coil DUF342 family protein